MSSNASAIAFSGGPFDHDETGRNPARLQKLVMDDTATCILLHEGNPALDIAGRLLKVKPKSLVGKNLQDPGPLYLGMADGEPLFAASLQNLSDITGGVAIEPLRNIANKMNAQDLAIAGRARSLFDWHFTHKFCSACGKASVPVMGGLKRECRSCNTQHFPRVNPVVIMLVLDGDDVLLGRQAGWPDKSYSALAGFVSPGETLEEACKREVWEEVGIMSDQADYIISQPWPFPSQLMVGMTCVANSRELTINTDELETAQWFSKETVRAVLAKESQAFFAPPRFTIARQLLERWASED